MSSKKLSTQEKVALAVSTGIVLASLIYWIVQIKGVMAMLELAYG